MSPSRPIFPESKSELARLIRDFDWSATPLGSLETWPASLRTITSFLLLSPVPMVLLWGEDGVMIYNDAYSVFAGGRHPQLLGSKVREGWPEVADFNDNVMRVGLAGGTLAYKDQELTLHRTGRPEQVWMNLDYSPVIDESGQPGGVIAIVIETTGRVLADRRIAEEQARQRRLFTQMPGFIGVLTGPEHVYEYVNDAYVAVSERSDFVGRTIREVFPDLAGQGFYELLDQVYATGKTVVTRGMELRLHGSDEVQYIDFVYEPIRDDDGTVTGIFVGGYEVTEAHRAAAALRESEARLLDLNADLERQVIERSSERGTTWQISPFMLSVVDLTTGRFVRVNPAWTAVLGYAPDEIIGHQYLEFLHPDDVERTMAGYSKVESGQPVLDFENRYRAKAGDYRWLSWVAVPDDGKLYSTVRDVTAEKAAATERERIFEVSRDLIGVAGFDGYLKSINPAWSAALGRTDEDLLAKSFSEIIHPDDLALTGEVVARLQGGRPADQFHVRLLRSDGEPISYAWSAVPDAAPESGLFYTVGRDITEQTAAAAELARTQEALRQSQKMEAVGQLTGGIAHDFNNLLAGIAGSLELMHKRITQQGLVGFDRHLGIAQASTQRAASLTQRLLAFSRRQTLDPKPTDVNRLINGVEDLFRRSVGPTIEISFIGAIGLWPTKIDAPQLENALLNLVINARDAMPDGGKITIETANKWIDGRTAKERDLQPGQYISVCVTDTGTGMTPEVIERAFDPFYTTKPLGQGTGLGLSMIHGFVRQSGGQVRIYSEFGEGTTMCLYLPRFAGDIDNDANIEIEEALEPGQGETVVVIDDEEPIRMLVSDVLEEAGYRILTAADGPSGLKILQSDVRIDLLITDVGLPGAFNGRQVADAARQARPELKVLFVTGYADNAVIGNGHLDPGMAVITKPFPMAMLALRVREMIEG